MKPILVLGPAQAGAPWLERKQVDLHRMESIEAVPGLPQDRQPALRDVDPRLKVELDRGVLSVEYQVV